MSHEPTSWKKRHRRRKRLSLEGWPPGVPIPKELLDELEHADAERKEVL